MDQGPYYRPRSLKLLGENPSRYKHGLQLFKRTPVAQEIIARIDIKFKIASNSRASAQQRNHSPE
jgi:hypothetical protein